MKKRMTILLGAGSSIEFVEKYKGQSLSIYFGKE
jgi:hypothetical protein